MTFWYKNKIELNEKIEEFIQCVKKIDWFANCGKKYEEKLYFDYVIEENVNEASKHLNQQTNSKGIVILERLLGEADSRLNWYLYNHYRKEHSVIASGKLIQLVNKRFADDLKIIDLNNQFLVLSEMFNIKYRDYNWLQWIFNGTVFELYFLVNITNIPVFYTKIFKVFQDGHVLTGWNGKFPPQNLCLETQIENKDVKMLIY
jgi:hypothetical protein